MAGFSCARSARRMAGNGYARRSAACGTSAEDRNPETLAPIHEMAWNLRDLTDATYQARGGEGEALPGGGRVSGRGRVDVRFAVDDDGEVYVLTKSDGMIRRIIGVR
jgi:hypothetical protein